MDHAAGRGRQDLGAGRRAEVEPGVERPALGERIAPLAVGAGQLEVVERRGERQGAREPLQGRQTLDVVAHRIGRHDQRRPTVRPDRAPRPGAGRPGRARGPSRARSSSSTSTPVSTNSCSSASVLPSTQSLSQSCAVSRRLRSCWTSSSSCATCQRRPTSTWRSASRCLADRGEPRSGSPPAVPRARTCPPATLCIRSSTSAIACSSSPTSVAGVVALLGDARELAIARGELPSEGVLDRGEVADRGALVLGGRLEPIDLLQQGGRRELGPGQQVGIRLLEPADLLVAVAQQVAVAEIADRGRGDPCREREDHGPGGELGLDRQVAPARAEPRDSARCGKAPLGQRRRAGHGRTPGISPLLIVGRQNKLPT